MNAPVCGYYGKLPVSREFLRLHAAGPELRELDEWFEKGMQYAKSKSGPDWPSLLAQSDIWNFLFFPQGNGRVVCGAVFASGDQAGRSFPFLIFLLLERRALPATPWLIPLSCRAFLTQARQLLNQLRVDLDWNGFRARVETLPTEVDTEASLEAGFEGYLSHTTTGEFWSHLRAAPDYPQRDGREQVRAMRLHQASTQSSVAGTWGLKLPLAKGQATETYDLPFWLGLQARVHGVEGGAWPALLAFWNRMPSKVEPCVLLSFGRSSPNLTRFIVTPDIQDDAWYEWQPQELKLRQNNSEGAVDRPRQIDDDADVSLKRYLGLLR